MSDAANRTIGQLEGLLCELTRKKPLTQAVVAVESGDRSFRWVGTEGLTASGDPVTEDTPFLIAIGLHVLVMQLAERVRLAEILGEPLDAYGTQIQRLLMLRRE